MIARALLFVCAVAARAAADDAADLTPCTDSIIDPIVTPVRDAELDAQRSACMRQELSAGLRAHALIDTPGFHGVLGGDLVLGGRLVIAKAHELSAALTLFDYTFVQNAVNKITHTGTGPIVLGAAAGGALGRGARAALSLRIEIPYTHDGSDDTLRSSAQLAGLVSGALAERVVLHARLAVIGRLTSSLGGDTQRLGLVSGADIVWQLRRRLAVQGGAEMMAGWAASFDHLMARAGVHWRMRGGAWRLRAGIGLPIAGDERTNAIFDAAIVVDR